MTKYKFLTHYYWRWNKLSHVVTRFKIQIEFIYICWALWKTKTAKTDGDKGDQRQRDRRQLKHLPEDPARWGVKTEWKKMLKCWESVGDFVRSGGGWCHWSEPSCNHMVEHPFCSSIQTWELSVTFLTAYYLYYLLDLTLEVHTSIPEYYLLTHNNDGIMFILSGVWSLATTRSVTGNLDQ